MNDDETESSAPTPRTPISKDSPMWPSSFKTIPCTYLDCDKTFNRPAKLAQHLRSHTNTRSFVCPNEGCTKDFLRSSHLQHHIKSAHSDVRDYVCEHEGCGKSFITGSRLKRHYAAHEGRQKFACTVDGCGQTFRKHNTLQKHLISIHEGRKAFTCQVLNDEGRPCGAGFETASNLKTHEGSVHSGRIYRCTVCDDNIPLNTDGISYDNERVTFPTLLALQAHIRVDHPPTCEECDSKFRSASDLAMHIDAQHATLEIDERRKHPCLEPGCGRSFTQKGNLVTHMKNFHSEDKAFVCGNVDLKTLTRIENWDGSNACGRSMSTKGNLVEHIRAVHLGLEPSRKARRKQKAADAKASASQAKPSTIKLLTGSGYEVGRSFECLLHDCDYRFQREYDLQRHLEHHHGLAELEIQMLRADADLSFIRQRLDGSYYMATTAEVDADRNLSRQFGNDGGFKDYFDELENSAAEGGDFWLGGGQQNEADMMESSDWDSMEMQGIDMNEHPIEKQHEIMGQDMVMIDSGLR